MEKVQAWFPRANIDAAYILGICYIQTKDYPKARVAFARMFDVPPDSAAGYLFTARMLLRQEFDPVAEEYARKAAALDPNIGDNPTTVVTSRSPGIVERGKGPAVESRLVWSR